MHIIIINSTPHLTQYSNTAKIVNTFKEGCESADATVEVFHLCNQKQYNEAKIAFLKNENIVFALPVYVGIVPSLFKKFIEELSVVSSPTKKKRKQKISYILQSGYPEASQRTCCEKYLASFTEHLDCYFAGILSHGIDYGMIENKSFLDLLQMYKDFGVEYIEHNASFHFDEAKLFNGLEYLTDNEAEKFTRYFNFLCRFNAREIGKEDSLYDKPYEPH